MSELAKLKKENKQLKALLRNAVDLLNKYKEVLKNSTQVAMEKSAKKAKKAKKDKKDKKDKGEKKDKADKKQKKGEK